MLDTISPTSAAAAGCVLLAFLVLVALALLMERRPPPPPRDLPRAGSNPRAIRKPVPAPLLAARIQALPPPSIDSILLDPIWDESDEEWKDEHQIAADRKGAQGEALVRSVIEDLGMDAVHDVYLPTDQGATQIDHAVRCGSTLVVIETKHYSGQVTGDRTGDKWTQAFANGRSFPFLNPLLQNANHVQAMRDFTGGDVRGLVVFTGYATFTGGRPGGVLIAPELKEALLQIQASFPDRSSRPDWMLLKRHSREAAAELRDAHARSIGLAKTKALSLHA